MQHEIGAGFLGTGMAVPERVLTNAELEKLVDTTHQWIVERTGIHERRITGPEEQCSTLAVEAARRALEDAGTAPEELDLIICGTATGDYIWPSTACLIQEALGAKRAGAFDLVAACSGFVYGLETAANFVRSGSMKRVLVVGVDVLTKITNWEDRGTCVLFGDGAGAAVIGPCQVGEGVLSSVLGSDGSGAPMIMLEAGGTRNPVTPEAIQAKKNRIYMNGREVYKFATRMMGDASLEAIRRAGLTPDQVDLFVPHQANIRIIESAAQRIGLPMDKVFLNVQRYGNTSAASIPIALCEARDEGRVRRGSVLVFVAFGAGFTWGANVVRWSRD